ncbi:TonB-dependent receptor plug domain-containing protein [Ahniella affigens]|nr:TonB-dependent receptor [Ahniella affigens]
MTITQSSQLSRNLLTIAIASVLAGGAHAADSAKKNDRDADRLEAVQVTATLVPEDSAKIASPVVVVGPEKLHQADGTVIESLRGTPGAFVQQTTPGQAAVFIRGSKGSEILHLVDGFRLNSGIFRNAPNQYFALVDGQSLDRLELLRGPSAGLYGSDAMGGVVNMLTPNPLELDEHSMRHEVRFRADSAQSLRIGHYSGAGKGENFAAQVSATTINVGNREIGGGDERPFSSFESNSVNAKLAYDAHDFGRFTLNVQDTYQPLTYRHDELVPGYGQTTATSATATFEPQQRTFAQLAWENSLDNGLFQNIRAQVGKQAIRDDRRSRDTGAFSEAQEQNTDRMTGGSVLLSGSNEGGHRYSVGAEAYGEKVKAYRTNVDIRTGVGTTALARFPNGSVQESWALYAIDDWEINDSVDWVIAGRYSDFNLDIPRQGSLAGVKIDNSAFSGHTGISVAVADGTRLVANVGRGFRAPNIFDVGQFGNRPSNRFAIPNPNLKPETLVSVDVGVKHDGDAFDFEAYAFQSQYDDKIVTVFTGRNVGSRREVQNVNATEATLYGVEFGFNWTLAEAWWLDGSLNYTRGTEKLDGNEAPADRIAPLNASLDLNWQMDDQWRFNAGVLAAATQDRLSDRDLGDPRIDPNGTGGWARWDIGTVYALNDAVDLSFQVQNIGDKQYREHGSGIDAVGRNFVLGVDWRF